MAAARKGKKKAVKPRYGTAPGRVQRARTYLVMGLFFCIFTAIGGRLCQLHLYPSARLLQEEEVHQGYRTLEAPRGEIFDRNGLLLATDREAPSVWVDPRRIHDPKRVASPQVLAAWLSPQLGLATDVILAAFNKRDSKGGLMKDVTLKRFIQDLDDKALAAMVLESGHALGVRDTTTRYYPQATTASHLLGFLSRDGEIAEGVEQKMDDHLRSVAGIFRARVDVGRNLLDSETLERKEPKGGEDVHLSIDTDLQRVLERALDKRMAECEAPRAMGLLMNPHTGAILALANRPAFDPNRYNESTAALRKNTAVLDVFEPGSAFKIVTAAAALELGIVTPETQIDCENGRFNPYGHTVHDSHALKVEPFSVCFAQSSNIGMIKVAARLGAERLDQWIRKFGFGVKTSRDFQSESAGIYRPREKWSRLSMGALPIGQEISVTMPQLARAFAVIANGGYLVEPYFIEKAVGRNGEETYRFKPGPRQRILSPATAATMRELCFQVVLKGTGRRAAIPEYRIGGKTGTAQMVRNAEEIERYGPGYSDKRYTAVFAGFAPVSQPRIVCVIVIPEPMGASHYGGTVCGPVFKQVVREALIKMNVPEEPMPEEGGPTLLTGNDADTVNERELFEFEGLNMADLFESLDALELVAAKTDQGRGMRRLPSFIGMTKREAKARLAPLGIPWDPRGAGWVVTQHPRPGTPLDEVTLCSLKFASKSTRVQDEAEKNS